MEPVTERFSALPNVIVSIADRLILPAMEPSSSPSCNRRCMWIRDTP